MSDKNLIIGNDVWFVGHCIVTPVNAKDKSMAMVGSVITKDMEYNTIYAGSPAKSVSEKIGFQFKERSLMEKQESLQNLYKKFGYCNEIKIVLEEEEVNFNDNISYFVVATRRYKKTLSANEISFMKFLLPEKAKFIPIE